MFIGTFDGKSDCAETFSENKLPNIFYCNSEEKNDINGCFSKTTNLHYTCIFHQPVVNSSMLFPMTALVCTSTHNLILNILLLQQIRNLMD